MSEFDDLVGRDAPPRVWLCGHVTKDAYGKGKDAVCHVLWTNDDSISNSRCRWGCNRRVIQCVCGADTEYCFVGRYGPNGCAYASWVTDRKDR